MRTVKHDVDAKRILTARACVQAETGRVLASAAHPSSERALQALHCRGTWGTRLLYALYGGVFGRVGGQFGEVVGVVLAGASLARPEGEDRVVHPGTLAGRGAGRVADDDLGVVAVQLVPRNVPNAELQLLLVPGGGVVQVDKGEVEVFEGVWLIRSLCGITGP